MNGKFQVYFSNRVELLFNRLKKSLFCDVPNPFAKRMVIVPSPAMKSWIMLRMAQDPNFGICAGMEISYLDETLANLHSMSSSQSVVPPTAMELALMIEVQIRNVIANYASLSIQEQSCWGPLLRYLKVLDKSLIFTISRKSERRLAALSEKLATLFLKYGDFGIRVLHEWEVNESESWQQELWKIVCQGLHLNASSFSLTSSGRPFLSFTQQADVSLYLFAMSFINKQQHQCLMEISRAFPVNYFLLSPCLAFWTDIRSDREARQLNEYWKNAGVSLEQNIALEGFLRDRNSLLANFGRMGREMALQVEESEGMTFEDYALPESIKCSPAYENQIDPDIHFQQTAHELTLLEAVQSDIALLRNPDKTPKIPIASSDDTIQFHEAASKLREVQILYDNLMRIIDRHSHEDDPICPGDIIVMAPDIMDYEPYIKSVLGNRDSGLDFQIMDLKMPAQSRFIQAFLHLLKLPFGRWDAAALYELCEFSAFQRCHKLSGDDVRRIWNWTKESGIRWGEDAEHRDELLIRDHCDSGMGVDSAKGTWDFAFSRLLAGLTMTINKDAVGNAADIAILPLESIDFTQSELLGKWIFLLKLLRHDLKALVDGRMTLEEWSLYLRSLCDAYLKPNHDDGEVEDASALHDLFESIRKASTKLKDAKFSFITIKKHLEAALNRQSSTYREHRLQSVRFCSMLPMRAIPSKVIALIGMQEGAFPRIETDISLNLLRGNPLSDYCPSQSDFDRYLFLESLISARRYFMLSYRGYSQTDGKMQPPSLLITELLSYLKKAFDYNARVIKHPFYAFDAQYFIEGSELKSYTASSYRAAKAHYHVDRSPPHRFIPQFVVTNDASELPHHEMKGVTTIKLDELASFARDPIKVFFNKTLGIYLEKEEDRELKKEENFDLSKLEAWSLTKDALTCSSDHIIQYADKQGIFPPGMFKKIAIDKIETEINVIKSNMANLGVEPEKFFAIELSERCQFPVQDPKGHWQVPSLKARLSNGIEVNIVGTLSHVSPKGMVVNDEESDKKRFKYFPLYLVFDCILKKYCLDIGNNLIFAKSKTSMCLRLENPDNLLQKYLEYYFKGHQNASPLIPDWIPSLLKKGPEEFSKKLNQDLDANNKFTRFFNPYPLWMVRGGSSFDGNEIYENWKPVAEQLFSCDIFNKSKEQEHEGI